MDISELEYYRDDAIEIIFVRRKEYIVPLHNHHASFQIIQVFNGLQCVEYQDEKIELHENEFVVIPPYKAHIEQSEGLVNILCLNIHKEVLERDAASVLNLLDDVMEKLQQRGLVDTAHIIDLTKAISQVLCLYRSEEDACPEFVAKVREMLEKWPEKDISIVEMAELVSVCRGHLIRTFKGEIGLTPHQFQIQNRVRKAPDLLINTNLSLEEIGQECGFYDNNHFKRHFRRLLGMTPGEYRRLYKGARQLLESG